jgi:hypothetical protein
MKKWIVAGGGVCLLAAGIWIAPAAARIYAASHFDVTVESVELPTLWTYLCTVDVHVRNRSVLSPTLQRVHVELWLRGRKLAFSDWPESGSNAPLAIPAGGAAPIRLNLKIGSHDVWSLIRGAGYPAEVKVDGMASLAGLEIPFHVAQEKRIPFLPCCIHREEPQPLQE